MDASLSSIVQLNRRSDITLAAFERVAWHGEPVEIGSAARAAIDRCHESFMALVAERLRSDPSALIYGVNLGPGDAGRVDLEHDDRPSRLWTAASFGDPLPGRVVRGIILARLANFIEGNAAARSEVADAVAAILDRDAPLPLVPAHNGGAGEILPLGHLFYDLSARLLLEPKERMALINGSPCAAALVADTALAARGRTALAEQVFALSVEALGSPLEAYSEDVEELWNDASETAALRSLRWLLQGHRPQRMAQQSPVSHRILARVLGRLHRAQHEADQAAEVSLQSVTDNPVYIAPDATRPLGAVFSTGGYHNSRAPAAMDGMAFAWTDICQLAARHTDKLLQHPATAAAFGSEFTYKPLHMAQNAWAEEARALAQPSLISLGGFAQNDVAEQAFPAWRKAEAIGRCLDRSLAILAVLATRAMDHGGHAVPPALHGLAQHVRAGVPPVDKARPLGPDVGALADAFTARVLGETTATG
jgi:histidine ammonia-lyase